MIDSGDDRTTRRVFFNDISWVWRETTKWRLVDSVTADESGDWDADATVATQPLVAASVRHLFARGPRSGKRTNVANSLKTTTINQLEYFDNLLILINNTEYQSKYGSLKFYYQWTLELKELFGRDESRLLEKPVLPNDNIFTKLKNNFIETYSFDSSRLLHYE